MQFYAHPECSFIQLEGDLQFNFAKLAMHSPLPGGTLQLASSYFSCSSRIPTLRSGSQLPQALISGDPTRSSILFSSIRTFCFIPQIYWDFTVSSSHISPVSSDLPPEPAQHFCKLLQGPCGLAIFHLGLPCQCLLHGSLFSALVSDFRGLPLLCLCLSTEVIICNSCLTLGYYAIVSKYLYVCFSVWVKIIHFINWKVTLVILNDNPLCSYVLGKYIYRCFQIVVLTKTLESPWTVRRSNLSILT